jgi:hypothetical protein
LNQSSPKGGLHIQLATIKKPAELPIEASGLDISLQTLIRKTLALNPQMGGGNGKRSHHASVLIGAS